jgi:hypothetical protein
MSLLLGLAIAGGILMLLLAVEALARRRRRRAVREARRARDRMRRRDELEHAQRVDRLKIVGGARPDRTEQLAHLSPAARGASAASGLGENAPEASPRPNPVPDERTSS